MEIAALIADLSSPEVAARRAAAERLSRNYAAEAVVPLVRACADADDQVRELASSGLEELGPPPLETAEILATHLAEGGSPGYWAATLLGRLRADGGPWSPALSTAVESNADMSVRQRAAWALGQIGPTAVGSIPALEGAARGNDPRLARLATDALAKINASP